MKKCIITILCWGILSTLFCGCGDRTAAMDTQAAKEEKTNAVTSGNPTGNGNTELPEGYVLLARFEDAGGETQMMEPHLVNHSLYYYTGSYHTKLDRYLAEFYIQEPGKEAQQHLSFGKEDLKDLMTMAAAEDGSVYFLYGEDRDEEDRFQVFTLEKWDNELQKIYSMDISEDVMAGEEEIYGFLSMKVGADGTVYALTESLVLCWNAAGEYQGRIRLPKTVATAANTGSSPAKTGSCFDLVNAGPSGIYAYWGGKDGKNGNCVYLYDLNKWKNMNEEEREAAEPLRIDFASAAEAISENFNNGLYVLSGYEDGLYLADKNRLWQIDLTNGSLKALFAWQDMSLRADYVKEVRRQEDGGFLLYIFDTLEQENYWVTLEPAPASEVPEKTELVLGVAGGTFGNSTSREGQSLASNINQVVLSFNRTHPNCHVTVREYERNQITNFQLELIGGTGPDILLDRESLFDMDSLMTKGAVEDLTAYLERAEGVSTEDMLPGLLNLIQKDGKISCLPLSFAVDVVIVPENTPQEVMTPQELVALMTQKDGLYRDYWTTSFNFLIQVLFGGEIEQYMDEANANCSFDSDAFIRLLETVTVLDNHERIENRQDRAELFHAGQLTAIMQELNCMEDYLCIRAAFEGTGKITGFPNSQGELRYPVKLYDRLGINSASEHKEEAWDFLSFCLSYTSRSDNVADRFVVMQDKFERQTQYEDTEDYFLWWNDYDDVWIGSQEIPPTTQEDTDFLRDIPNHLYLYENPDLQQVIKEEADAFFGGGIDANEAAKRIQNRASLVLGE